MMPLEPASRRAFFAGLVVGVGFRWFAYGTLLFSVLEGFWRLNGIGQWAVVGCPLIASCFVSPLVVPFLAGFASAFFWRQVIWREEVKDKSIALWLCTLLCLPFHLLVVGCCLLLTLPIDYACSDSGLQRGEAFWNGRLGRQFLGDFSTRDEDL